MNGIPFDDISVSSEDSDYENDNYDPTDFYDSWLDDYPEAPEPPKSCPKLTTLCCNTIASNMHRYDPSSFNGLPEPQWEDIITTLHLKSPSYCFKSYYPWEKYRSLHTPILAPKFIMELEASNPFLSSSMKVDELVWRDCVNFTYPKGTRPSISIMLWKDWVVALKELGEEFPTFCQKGSKSPFFRVARLKEILDILNRTPMNNALLSETGIGNSIRAFIDRCNSIVPKGQNIEDCTLPEFFPNVWDKTHIEWDITPNGYSSDEDGKSDATPPLSILEQLELVLQQWDKMELETGRGASVIELELYRKDIEMMQECHSWRELYKALSTRREEMTKKTRETKRRKVEEDLDVCKKG